MSYNNTLEEDVLFFAEENERAVPRTADMWKVVIIDDDKMLNGLPESIKRNLILTSSSVGLTDDLADEAISILKNDYQ